MNRDVGSTGNVGSGVGAGLGTADAISGGIGVGEAPLMYNDDELAALAESLFDRRADFTGQEPAWWNVGNL
jgi:hypothetical protein